LRIISGLENADGGTVECNGKIAYMFQEARLLPWKSARENILAVLKKEKAALVDKYLDAVGLSDDKDKLPTSLSGGMAQRVAFARFLAYAEATDADILLLDEPFSALDGDTADEMIALLDKFAKNKTLILVTHDEGHADALGAKTVEL
jgi:ABC-type nitrate/sulfonate/bicarbonate transport system ATPase subunit